MKNVMVLLHEDAGQEARIDAALDLTRALNGHLMCLDVCPPPPPLPFSMLDAEILLFEDLQSREKVNRSAVARRLATEDVPSSMTYMTGDIAECMADQVRLADVVVLNCELDDRAAPNMPAIACEMVTKLQKPVLAVPQDSRSFNVGGTALIAWDGSSSAAAALSRSIPIICLASAVLLVEVARSDCPMVEDAAQYLSRHGVNPELLLVHSSTNNSRLVAEQLRTVCLDRQVDYCVMGAFGHSILRERVFGGVTREMFRNSPVPLVLAH